MRSAPTALVTFPLFASLAAACAIALAGHRADCRDREAPSEREIGERVSELRAGPIDFSTRPPEEMVDAYEDCAEFAVDLALIDPSTGEPRIQAISAWIPTEGRGRRAASIIVPTLEGRWFIEDRVASWLCSAGMVAVIADVNETFIPSQLPDWGLEDRRMRRSVFALEAVVDWVSGDARVDQNRIGAIGISLGAITTALWSGVDPRLKAALLVAGGGNIPEMLSRSGQKLIVELREKRMKAAHLKTAEEYEMELHKSVRYDPLFFAGLSTAQIRIISGNADDHVPFDNQTALWEAFRRPERFIYDGQGHVGTILRWAYFHMGESVDWMKKQLRGADAVAEATIGGQKFASPASGSSERNRPG